CLLRKEIHDPPEAFAGADRNLHRYGARRQVLLDVTENLLEVGVLPIHHAHEDDGGKAPLPQQLPGSLSSYLHPRRSRDHYHRTISHADTGLRFADEVE